MLWYRQAIFKSKGDKLSSSAECRIRTQGLRHLFASRLNAYIYIYIYASINLAIIGPDNGLSPDRRQAIIWSNAEIFLIEPLGKNFSDIWTEIHTFSFKEIYLKMSSGKWMNTDCSNIVHRNNPWQLVQAWCRIYASDVWSPLLQVMNDLSFVRHQTISSANADLLDAISFDI